MDGGDGNGELVARGEHRGTLAYAGDRGEGTEGAAREMLVVDFPACENGPGSLVLINEDRGGVYHRRPNGARRADGKEPVSVAEILLREEET